MEVDAVNVFHGAWYRNLWVLNENEIETNNTIEFYLYLDALQDVAMKTPQLTNEAIMKYKRIVCLEMGLHSIHI